ncbi:Severe Depolymerization of Actin [Salix suchowensis]|nr:Severe Depolymerization of Actin [Salix suchowensis]
MSFGMVERGMDGEVQGDKGKLRANNSGPTSDKAAHGGEDAIWAIILTKELWRKGVWTDTKPVSIIALGCFHPVLKVQSASLHFFLGGDEEKEDSDDEGDDKKYGNQPTPNNPNFPALQLLNDPQTFAEKLYDLLNRYDKRFSLEHKVLMMQLLSRVMGAHKLCVLDFYTYIFKYLTYHQLRIPSILVALAQSVHDLTPPDALTPVVRKLAHEFIHPGVASEVVAAGINAIREVCRRQPWAMEEDLLGDLIEYRKSKDKSVTAAARGLLQLYRDVNPGMLKRRERGKEAAIGMAAGSHQPLPFGHSADAAVDIAGLALLEDHLKQLREEDGVEDKEDDETAWDNWDVGSDSSDSHSESEGWVDVPSEGGSDIEVSDSEDEKDPEAKAEKEVDPADRVSTLATTKILTPADFALLHDLRLQAAAKAVEAGGGSKAKRKLAALEAERKVAREGANEEDTFVSENDILGPRKKAKADYEERMASIQKGRDGRDKFGSRKGKKNKETASSSTNREKARNKPIMMILSSGAVKGKKKRSLREKQQKLRAHINLAKKSR